MAKTFIEQFKEIISEEGNVSIEKFINDWVSGGSSFRELYGWLKMKGVSITYSRVWICLRVYLTVPYDSESAFWYRWNSIAKAKKYSSIENLVEDYKKKYTMREISEELGVHIRTVELMVNRVNKKMGWPVSPLHSKHKNSEGFTRKPTKEKWDKIVKSKGFLSLREAVYEYSKKGLTVRKMAQEFGVCETSLQKRILLGKMKLYKKRKKTNRKILV